MRPLRGVSLVDVIVGSALVLIIFMGLFALLRASIQVTGISKLKAAATELASSQMEYIRSLDYDDIGTVGGIPAGLIAQNATTTNGGVPFGVRTFIEYADDPKDGSGAADVNHITTDYKHVKIVVTYYVNGVGRQVTLVSNAAPPGIESTTGGGTLQLKAVNATGAAVSGASVRVRNSSTSPTIDVTTFTDSLGIVYLPGAPTSTQYRIDVTKDGYSTAQTYVRDATNQNPNPGYLTVVGGSTTSGTFAIDQLATMILRTFSPIVAALWSDPFDNLSLVAASSNVQIVGSTLTLTSTAGSYAASGEATSVVVAPTYLSAWKSASSTMSTPASTSIRVSVLDGSGALLPDAVLAGNSTGFTGTIDLSAISTSTYPSLALRARLTTSDPLATPSLDTWRLGYDRGPVPLPNVSYTLRGGKTIGSTGAGAAIYKTTIATSSGANASTTLSLEWDSYTLTVPAYTIVDADPDVPYEVLPGASIDARLILTP